MLDRALFTLAFVMRWLGAQECGKPTGHRVQRVSHDTDCQHCVIHADLLGNSGARCEEAIAAFAKPVQLLLIKKSKDEQFTECFEWSILSTKFEIFAYRLLLTPTSLGQRMVCHLLTTLLERLVHSDLVRICRFMQAVYAHATSVPHLGHLILRRFILVRRLARMLVAMTMRRYAQSWPEVRCVTGTK
jgi:hypothetical protein